MIKKGKKIEKTIEFAGRKLVLGTGLMANQSTSAVVAQYGDTVCLATVMAVDLKEEMDYFPLSVEYQEKLYAGGRIKGSKWVKRGGRPTDEEILTGRLIDRSIRPLFPKGYIKDVQVIITVLSVDQENSPDIVSAVAASAALTASSIPFDGPVGVVRVGLSDGKYVLNPTLDEIEKSDIDLVVSSTDDAVVMIEAGANEMPEDKVIDAIELAHKENKKINDFIRDFAKAVGAKKDKVEVVGRDKALIAKVKDLTKDVLLDLAAKMATKEAGYPEYDAAKALVLTHFEEEQKSEVFKTFDELFEEVIRNKILSGVRVDGRKTNELRSLSADVSILPRTHGSALFNRGQTQALTIATLGSKSAEQLLESAMGEVAKRYIHHYSMPPFSTGETGRVGSPKRREIGHGALSERALLPVIPSFEEFPYTIQVVTEILSSNGSTSMASVCGSTLSMMDAGVPIKKPVAGIAMGVVVENKDNFKVLTDIVGIEDGNGDMDFKVAGTTDGITALQLDVKTTSLTPSMLKVAFEQAREARMQILNVMLKALPESRKSVSKYAPKIQIVKIDVEKIGELIGPSGKTIKKLSADTGAEISVEDDGSVSISAVDASALEEAVKKVENITKDIKEGEVYDGVVTRIEPFGAFVEVLPGKQGLVHVSDMSVDYVNDPGEVVKMGQTVTVRVKEVDQMKRVNFTMILDETAAAEKKRSSSPARSGSSGQGSQGGRSGGSYFRPSSGGRDNNRGGMSSNRGRNFGPRRSDSRDNNSRTSGGPHFPASRLAETGGKDYTR